MLLRLKRHLLNEAPKGLIPFWEKLLTVPCWIIYTWFMVTPMCFNAKLRSIILGNSRCPTPIYI